MRYIFTPTYEGALRYCDERGWNPKEFVILDTINPWYIIEGRINNTAEESNHVIIPDNTFDNVEAFNTVMEYLETADGFTLEIV